MNELQEARRQLGVAIHQARDLGTKMDRNPSRTRQYREDFDRAMADVRQLQRKVERLALPPPSKVLPDWALQEQSGGLAAEHQALHTRAFALYLREGGASAREYLRSQGAPQELHLLLSPDDSLGGFAVPDDFKSEVLRNLAGFAVVRMAGARVISTTSGAAVFPTLNEGVDPYATDINSGVSNWKAEGEVSGGAAPPTQSKPTWGQERIPVHRWSPDVIEISEELLDDSAANLDATLAEVIAEQRALDEDVAFLTGDGLGKPEGITQSGATEITFGADTGGLTYDHLVNLFVGLPAQYRANARWIFNSSTLGEILKLSETTNRPLFPVNAIPGTLFNRPYHVSEFMDDITGGSAAGNVGASFGDFRYYIIAERTNLIVRRLVERFAPNVGFLPVARIGGQVVRKAAFRLGVVGS